MPYEGVFKKKNVKCLAVRIFYLTFVSLVIKEMKLSNDNKYRIRFDGKIKAATLDRLIIRGMVPLIDEYVGYEIAKLRGIKVTAEDREDICSEILTNMLTTKYYLRYDINIGGWEAFMRDFVQKRFCDWLRKKVKEIRRFSNLGWDMPDTDCYCVPDEYVAEDLPKWSDLTLAQRRLILTEYRSGTLSKELRDIYGAEITRAERRRSFNRRKLHSASKHAPLAAAPIDRPYSHRKKLRKRRRRPPVLEPRIIRGRIPVPVTARPVDRFQPPKAPPEPPEPPRQETYHVYHRPNLRSLGGNDCTPDFMKDFMKDLLSNKFSQHQYN